MASLLPRGRFAPTLAAALVLGSGAAAVLAQPVVIEVAPPPCLPREGNAPLWATVTPDLPENSVRLYFQRAGYGDLYYLVMTRAGAGRFWAVLPKPEEQNESVEVHVHVRSQDDHALQSSPNLSIPVTGDCDVELTDEQEEIGEELRVGETNVSQRNRPVAWFLCDGIIERIDPEGEVRPDEFCGVPPGPAPIVAEGGKGSVIDGDPPNVSPATLADGPTNQ